MDHQRLTINLELFSGKTIIVVALIAMKCQLWTCWFHPVQSLRWIFRMAWNSWDLAAILTKLWSTSGSREATGKITGVVGMFWEAKALVFVKLSPVGKSCREFQLMTFNPLKLEKVESKSGLKDLVFGAYFDQPLEDVDFPEGLDARQPSGWPLSGSMGNRSIWEVRNDVFLSNLTFKTKR